MVTIFPNFSLYKIVVLPAASSPIIRIRTFGFEWNFHKPAPIDDIEHVFEINIEVTRLVSLQLVLEISSNITDISDVHKVHWPHN